MGSCKINIHGVKVKAKVADCASVADSRINDLHFHLKDKHTKVVGIDAKIKSACKIGCESQEILVLFARNHCLIIHLDHLGPKLPQSLTDFLRDTTICLVGVTGQLRLRYPYSVEVDMAVEVGDLAARVARKPGLTTSSLARIAKEVGVLYDGPTGETGKQIEVDSRNTRVSTDEQMKAAINDAAAYYHIGYKLLTSL